MQALWVVNANLITSTPNPEPGRDDDLYLRDPPKPLGLSSLVSFIDIKESANIFRETSRDLAAFFKAFRRDPAVWRVSS